MNRLSPTPGPRGTRAVTRLLALLLHLALLLAPVRAAMADPAAGCAMPATAMDRMDQTDGMHAETAPGAMAAATAAHSATPHSATPHSGAHPCCPPHAACRHDGACLQPGHCPAAWLVPAPPVRFHRAPVVPAAFAPPRPSGRDGLAHAPSIPPPRPPV
ncbi:hypothetical protein AAC691_17570 [Nguyenibacter vanlangensis]|uniref:CopL family metal-binding regulatory protein n=1 Tax=Nguyenibacter vanlangensis TaxID=1216886 RepID=A0ABZ3D327_9PROT